MQAQETDKKNIAQWFTQTKADYEVEEMLQAYHRMEKMNTMYIT
jgi:hypothetical protein